MPFSLSGQVAGGVDNALEQVLQRRLQEQIRQQQEQDRAAQLQLQREQLAGVNADREADNARQMKVLDLANLQRLGQQNQMDTERRGANNLAGMVDMGLPPEQLKRESAGVQLRAGMGDPAKIIEGLTKIEEPKRDPIADYRKHKEIDREFAPPVKPEKQPDEPLVAIMGPDGVPVLVRRSDAEGKRPASTREQGRPVMVSSAKDLSSIDEALKLAGKLDFKSSDTGVMPALGAAMPDAVTSLTGFGVEAKQRQGVINLVKQIIGKGLEGGVLRKEDEAKYEKILPTLGDHPDVVKTKIDNLISTMSMKRQTLLDSLTDAGFDTSRFVDRGEPNATPAPDAGGTSRVDALIKKYGGG